VFSPVALLAQTESSSTPRVSGLAPSPTPEPLETTLSVALVLPRLMDVLMTIYETKSWYFELKFTPLCRNPMLLYRTLLF